jgi:peptidyl-prolyl cis-trans isomerase C
MNTHLRVGIGAMLLIIAGASFAQETAPGDQAVVTVNGDTIHVAEVNLAMQNIAAQLQMEGRQISADELFQAGTSQVISTLLLVQEAERRELTLDPERVDAILQQIEAQQGGREPLEGALAEIGATYDDLGTAIRQAEVAQILIEKEIRPGVQVSDDEVAAFYRDNPRMFETEDQVRARHILFTATEDASEEDRKAAQGRAVLARQRAIDGEDFAGLAKELSEGPSAADGGDLGFFSAEQMVQPFATAAFSLQPGEISEVVETRFGYHVIKVEERRPGASRSLDEVREPLRNALIERKVATAVGELVDELRSAADIVPANTEATSG